MAHYTVTKSSPVYVETLSFIKWTLILLIGLKIVGYVPQIPWWVILSPLWLPAAGVTAFFGAAFIVGVLQGIPCAIKQLRERKKEEKDGQENP